MASADRQGQAGGARVLPAGASFLPTCILLLHGLEQVGSLLQPQFCLFAKMRLSLLHVRVHVCTRVRARVMTDGGKGTNYHIWHTVGAP